MLGWSWKRDWLVIQIKGWRHAPVWSFPLFTRLSMNSAAISTSQPFSPPGPATGHFLLSTGATLLPQGPHASCFSCSRSACLFCTSLHALAPDATFSEGSSMICETAVITPFYSFLAPFCSSFSILLTLFIAVWPPLVHSYLCEKDKAFVSFANCCIFETQKRAEHIPGIQ